MVQSSSMQRIKYKTAWALEMYRKDISDIKRTVFSIFGAAFFYFFLKQVFDEVYKQIAKKVKGTDLRVFLILIQGVGGCFFFALFLLWQALTVQARKCFTGIWAFSSLKHGLVTTGNMSIVTKTSSVGSFCTRSAYLECRPSSSVARLKSRQHLDLVIPLSCSVGG